MEKAAEAGRVWTPEAILEEMEREDGNFPAEALAAAVREKEAVIPGLLRILEAAAADPQGRLQNPDCRNPAFAMYLLAQFREARAAPILCRLLALPADWFEVFPGDFVTEALPDILASVSVEDTAPLKRLAEDENAEEFVRSSALNAMVLLAAAGIVSREEILLYFKGLFLTGRPRKACHFWAGLVWCSMDLHPEEILGEIRSAFEAGLVDPDDGKIEEVEAVLRGTKGEWRSRLSERPAGLVDDAPADLEFWFTDDDDPEDFEGSLGEATGEELEELPPVGFDGPEKVGRNDPCPCGSGKKFKKCCLEKEPPPERAREAGKGGEFTRAEALARAARAGSGMRLPFAPAPEDAPVVDDEGFRIVSPGQALRDFLRPLRDHLREKRVPESLPELLPAGMRLWNLATGEARGETGAERDELRRVTERELAALGLPDPPAFIGRMTDRYRAMYPDPGKPGFFSMRERNVDPLVPWTPFDPSVLPWMHEPVGATAEDRFALDAIRRCDRMVAGGASAEPAERAVREAQVKLKKAFAAWMGRRGLPEAWQGAFGRLADGFLNLLYLHAKKTFTRGAEGCAEAFLETHLFRNEDLDGTLHSAAPHVLPLLGRYLDELRYTTDLGRRFERAVEPHRAGYLSTLEKFYGPAAAGTST